jgi:hypothetical protein
MHDEIWDTMEKVKSEGGFTNVLKELKMSTGHALLDTLMKDGSVSPEKGAEFCQAYIKSTLEGICSSFMSCPPVRISAS